MKKVLLTLLAIVLVAGVLGVTGLTAYRYGYANGISNNPSLPSLGSDNGFGRNKMPMHNFEYGMRPGFGRGFGGHTMMKGGGFGFFPFFGFLVQLAVIALVVWLVYKFTKGWRLTLSAPTSATPMTSPPSAEETSNTSN